MDKLKISVCQEGKAELVIEETWDMMKAKALAFMTILMLVLTGCGKEEQEPLRVYSFSGENEQFAVSNGIIVLYYRRNGRRRGGD